VIDLVHEDDKAREVIDLVDKDDWWMSSCQKFQE
jgi:hypothetical protein